MHTWTGAGRGLRNVVRHLRLVTLAGKAFPFLFCLSNIFLKNSVSSKTWLWHTIVVLIYPRIVCFKSCTFAKPHQLIKKKCRSCLVEPETQEPNQLCKVSESIEV